MNSGADKDTIQAYANKSSTDTYEAAGRTLSNTSAALNQIVTGIIKKFKLGQRQFDIRN